MSNPSKRIGELLVEAGLISQSQLQAALVRQRATGGRIGSTLVEMGFISEDGLMDFLAQQTGVPRVNIRDLDVDVSLLKKIPKRLAEQFTIMPVSFKEPRTLVLAMADPSDLNAIDSARFAAGLQIEPVVASYRALRQAIQDQYRKLGSSTGTTVEIGGHFEEGSIQLALDVDSEPFTLELSRGIGPAAPTPSKLPPDPFFEAPPSPTIVPSFRPDQPALAPPSVLPPDPFGVFGSRDKKTVPPRRMEVIGTRALVMGMIKLFQKRGVIGQDELEWFIARLIESGEIKDDEKRDREDSAY